MKIMRSARVATIAATMAAAVGLAAIRAPLGVAALDSCSAITPRSLEAYQRTITAAHRSATADASKNGTSGQHAVAATNSRDLLKRAQGRVASAISDLERSDASVTTATEAGTVKEHMRYILEVVPQAAHWSIISEIYHDSPDAWKAFEGSIKVLEEGNRLFAEAGRCYMEGL
jgi:hypothetical protein